MMNQSRNPLIDYRIDSAIALKAESFKTIVDILLEISTSQKKKLGKDNSIIFYHHINNEQSMLQTRKL